MDIYRVVLQPRGAYIFNWGSDALFGSLCWVIRDTAGEKELSEFLDFCRNGKPPVVFSNGFPGDWLPRPCTLLIKHEKASKKELIERSRLRKKIKGINYLNLAEFKEVLHGNVPKFDGSEPERKPEPKVQTTYHNSIDRLSGTTMHEGGGLYTVDEYFEQGTVTVYMRIASGWESRTADLLQMIGLRGVGARKSSGRGAFDVRDFSRFTGWPLISDADGFISLSNYVPAPNDPVDGLYRISVKFGRLDRELAARGVPFKRPLIQLLPGAVFRVKSDEKVKSFYGCLMENVAIAFPAAVQGCFTLAVPCMTGGIYPVQHKGSTG